MADSLQAGTFTGTSKFLRLLETLETVRSAGLNALSDNPFATRSKISLCMH